MVGRTLSHYRIDDRLGAGGMGEVYRARDLKLDRDVAVKILPPRALASEKARRRLRKEAQVLSRLSHPHIATLFDFDSADGVDFLVMELVTGPTLEACLQQGPLPEKDVLRLGAQLVRGLQAAHEQGVIHRDLKPSNLGLTPDGLLKILDFGVALFLLPTPASRDHITDTQTAAGAVVGSPPYMAPEQLLGKPIDVRTDLYACGAVLYELATGRRPFGSRSGVALTDAILHEPPPSPRSLDGSLSIGLEAMILKALDKDPELRYQSAKELLVDLERVGTRGSELQTTGRAGLTSRRSTPRRQLLRAALVVIPCAAALLLLRPTGSPRITATRPLNTGLDATSIDWIVPSWATDGTRLYYLGRKGRRVALFQAPVTGGEAVESPLPFREFNRIVGYAAGESSLVMMGSDRGWPDVWLWRVPVAAGTPVRIGDLEASWAAALSRDGLRIAVDRQNTILVATGEGVVEHTLGPLPSAPVDLAWSPDGRRIRYSATGRDGTESWIWEVPVAGGAARPLWPGRNGRWSGDGRYFLFEREDRRERRGDLYAVRDRPWPPIRTASPVRLTSGPLSFAQPGTAPDGTRLFAWGVVSRGELMKLDTRSQRLEPYLGGISATDVDPTRDGAWVVWVSHPEGALWRGRPTGAERMRLTRPGWQALLPRWSPDGQKLVFVARSPKEAWGSLYVLPRDGGEPRLLVRNAADRMSMWDSCWLPDARTVVFSHVNDARPGIYRVDVETREMQMLPAADRLKYPKCSPTGDVLALGPPEGGVPTFWVLRVGRQAWEPLGTWDAGYQSWSPDGRSIVALNSRGRIERLTPATGKLEVLADLGDVSLVVRGGTQWLGLAHDGSPLVTRDRSVRDLYAFDWEAP